MALCLQLQEAQSRTERAVPLPIPPQPYAATDSVETITDRTAVADIMPAPAQDRGAPAGGTADSRGATSLPLPLAKAKAPKRKREFDFSK